MPSLSFNGSHEFSHGRSLSVGKGVADGFEGERSSLSSIREDHREAYELGYETGERLKAGMLYELMRDRRNSEVASQDESGSYQLGREIGNYLRDRISDAERPVAS